MDGPRDRGYRITITLRFADARVRDPDGAVSTILDVIVRACRQVDKQLR